MADVERLIEQILSDAKLKNSRHFASTVYRDEPILRPAAQMDSFLPAAYRDMRRIAAHASAGGRSEAWLFVEQGKFMEHIEDSYDYHGAFFRYFPTYQSMNDQQLRGYFSWRTQVRRGDIRQTQLSFAFVYIYELLNLIGVSSPEEGFQTLRHFWTAYRVFDPAIDRYMRSWINDYVVYYQLDRSLLHDQADAAFDRALAVLLKADTQPDSALFPALCVLSSYSLENSRLYKQIPDEVETVVCGTFRALAAYDQKHRRQGLCEKLFGRKLDSPYSMFSAAVFYDSRRYQDYTYAVSELQTYRCQNGYWHCEKYYGNRYPGKNRTLGSILRAVDSRMREKLAFSHPLRAEKITKLLTGIIDREIDACLAARRAAAVPQVQIDRTKLGDIRRIAGETLDRLLADLPPEEPPAPPSPPPTDVIGGGADHTALTAAQHQFLRHLLYGTPFEDARHMPSLLAEGINEAFFEHFGDTVIDFDGDTPLLIEDYMDELKGMIPL